MAPLHFLAGLTGLLPLAASWAQAPDFPISSQPPAAPPPAVSTTAKPAPPAAEEAARFLEELPSLTAPSAMEEKSAAELPPLPQAEKALGLARAKAERWQKLFERGVLAKREVEEAELAAAKAAFTVAQVRLAEAERACVAGADGQIPAEKEAARAQCAQARREAETAWEALRLQHAELNLERARRLFKDHLITRAELQQAEALVQRLAKPAAPEIQSPASAAPAAR